LNFHYITDVGLNMKTKTKKIKKTHYTQKKIQTQFKFSHDIDVPIILAG